MAKTDLPVPSLRFWRNLRTMFSTSMIASSTTTPMETMSPARIITLITAPNSCNTSTAASREGDRNQADERRAPLKEEGGQDKYHKQYTEQQRLGEVAECQLDEGCRTEDRSVYLHARKSRAHVVDRLFDSPRNR